MERPDMTSGRPLERRDKLLVWHLVHCGMRSLTTLSRETGFCCKTIRDILLDGCDENWCRITEQRQRERLEEIIGRSDPE